jgi:hypothetical protein
MWGRWNIANEYRHLEAAFHRTHFNKVLQPQAGETIYVVIDDSRRAKRGRYREQRFHFASTLKSNRRLYPQPRGMVRVKDMIRRLHNVRLSDSR